MLIGITGEKGAGKDSLGAALVRTGFTRTAYADPLKAICIMMFGLTHDQVNGTVEQKEAVDPRWGKSPREILQLMGTDVARTIHADVWIRLMFNGIDAAETMNRGAAPMNWVVTDVRFENEADAIRERGGIIVRVERPTPQGNQKLAQHESEAGAKLIEADFVVYNEKDFAKPEHAAKWFDARAAELLKQAPKLLAKRKVEEARKPS